MNLVAKTVYTQQVVQDYLWFNICRSRHYRLVIPLVFYLCSAVLLGAAALFFATTNFVFLNIGLFTLVLVPFLGNYIFFKPKKFYRIYHSTVEKPNLYNFYSDYFQIRSERTVDETTDIYYNDLHKAYETDEYFLLYTMKRKACLVGKRGFEVGAPETLRKTLDDKLGKRFKQLSKT